MIFESTNRFIYEQFALIFDFKQVQSRVYTSYCVIFSSLVIGLTKCVNNRSPSLIMFNYFALKKRNFMYISKCFYRRRKTYFQVYYIVFAKDLILSFPAKPRKKYVRWLERNRIYHQF